MSACGITLGSNIGLALYRHHNPAFHLASGRRLFGGVRSKSRRSLMRRSRCRADLSCAYWQSPRHRHARWRHCYGRHCRAAISPVVVLTHPFEFVKYRDFRYRDMRRNTFNQNRLERLLDFITRHSDLFSVTTFAQSGAEWFAAEAAPGDLLQMPTAGSRPDRRKCRQYLDLAVLTKSQGPKRNNMVRDRHGKALPRRKPGDPSSARQAKQWIPAFAGKAPWLRFHPGRVGQWITNRPSTRAARSPRPRPAPSACRTRAPAAGISCRSRAPGSAAPAADTSAPARMRAATDLGGFDRGIAEVEHAQHDLSCPARSRSTPRSSFGCAASIEICCGAGVGKLRQERIAGRLVARAPPRRSRSTDARRSARRCPASARLIAGTAKRRASSGSCAPRARRAGSRRRRPPSGRATSALTAAAKSIASSSSSS